MSKRAIWILAGVAGIGGTLLILVAVILPLMVGGWPVGMEGEIGRRRIAIEMVVADGDREVRNIVQQECVTNRSGGFNTGRYIGIHKLGEAPFAVLPSGRALLLTGHFDVCSSPAGILDPDLPHGENRDGRIFVPGESAVLYDRVDAPTVEATYHLPEMFRTGFDGVRIKEMKVSDIPVSGELPLTRASALPWFNHPGVSSPDYDKDHHLRNFQGHHLTVFQLQKPCDGMAPNVSEPQLNTDSQFTPCRSTGGKRLGWLIGKPNADFSELQFSTDEASPVRYGVKYLEAMLREKAPGKWRPATELSPRRYAWTPRLCIDGYCFRPEPEQHLVWTKYELYLPKSKRVVSIDPD